MAEISNVQLFNYQGINKKDPTNFNQATTNPVSIFNQNTQTKINANSTSTTTSNEDYQGLTNGMEVDPNHVQINGEIEGFVQSYTEGDCWLLASLEAASKTKFGAEAIKNAISQDGNGNYSVTFTDENGEKEVHTFTEQQILDAKSRLSRGDDDVRLLELAFEEHQYKTITDDDPENDKYLGMQSTKEDPLRTGSTKLPMLLLAGKSSDVVPDYYIDQDINTRLGDINLQIPKNYTIDECLDKICQNPDNNCGIVSYINPETKSQHAYAIKSVDDQFVVLTNPHNTLKAEVMLRDKFEENLVCLTFTTNDDPVKEWLS